MSERISFIGLGNMGQPMARNIITAGYKLWIYNRDPSKGRQLVELGARQAFRPSEVVEPGGITITMVADDRALENVVLGEGGFLEQLGPKGIHLSMSTVSPTIAHKLADQHAKHGSIYLAAPVFGRPEAATDQKLWICLSGSQEAKERVQPILNVLGQGIFDFGEDPSTANVVKLVGNFLMVSAMEAMAEALTLAEKNGIDRSKVMDMLGKTLFACPVYQSYGKTIAEKRHAPVGFRLLLGLKDIDLVLQAATSAGMPMSVASLLHDRLIVAVARGRGDMDESALALGVLEDAGLL